LLEAAVKNRKLVAEKAEPSAEVASLRARVGAMDMADAAPATPVDLDELRDCPRRLNSALGTTRGPDRNRNYGRGGNSRSGAYRPAACAGAGRLRSQKLSQKRGSTRNRLNFNARVAAPIARSLHPASRRYSATMRAFFRVVGGADEQYIFWRRPGERWPGRNAVSQPSGHSPVHAFR
jgi:hypothetical protein